MRFFFSFIIPVYNRPDEVRELLNSFSGIDTSGLDYEVLIIEDGSENDSERVVRSFKKQLPVRYFYKKNSGPGDSRNYGMQRALGNYFVILDSDLILPQTYLQNLNAFLKNHNVDCFGGPDAADKSFSPVQKAINFVMTSFLTTGGIRGKKTSLKGFEPRSFNMGLSKEVFDATGGYGKIHPGEDPELSIRIRKNGFKTAFAPEVYVYHKRRIDWDKFYTQVYKFGLARPIINRWHPGASSFVFWLPSLFITGMGLGLLLAVFGVYWLISLYILYFLLIFVVSGLFHRNIRIGGMSLWATIIQFFGYGTGFLKSSFLIKFRRKVPEKVFPKLFFK